MILTFGDYTKDFLAYQNNEVDHASSFTPADIELISKDPELSKEYHPGFGDFRTYYLGFNNLEKPFNDIKVRQAFAKAIDRDRDHRTVSSSSRASPAYSFLMPGFPDASADVLKKWMSTSTIRPRPSKLLADAGYPDGKGFPKHGAVAAPGERPEQGDRKRDRRHAQGEPGHPGGGLQQGDQGCSWIL